MFGRRKREEAAAEAAREAERRALFARLAERPDHVCPFLGLVDERTGYVDGVSEDHRCYAFGDPASLSAEQQTRVCQERGYGNCPRYLRGVLVIPTEELEALRRPHAMPVAPPPSAEAPPRRRAPIVALLVLLLVVAGGAAAGWLAFGSGLIAMPGASPSPTADPTAAATVADTPSPAPPGPTPTVEPTDPPAETQPPTPTPDPTPVPEDTFDFWEVGVSADDYTLFRINAAGEIVAQRGATFSRFSRAEVERIVATNGLLHWRTIEGEYAGLSYIYPRSGNFEVREVFRRPDGSRSSQVLPEDER